MNPSRNNQVGQCLGFRWCQLHKEGPSLLHSHYCRCIDYTEYRE